MSSFINNLEWRRAIKHFDNNEQITNEQISKIMQSIIETPTSFGIQPFHVILIQSPELKKRLKPLSFDQEQIVECHTLFIFCVRTDVRERIEQYIEQSGISEEQQQIIYDFVSSHENDLSLSIWATRQVYIALGFAIAAATELKVPSCPMEGFDPVKVSKLLKLPLHYQPMVYLTIGGESKEQHPYPKFRFKKKDIFSKYTK